MAAGFWTETRPNGKPIEAGTVCWVTEPIDGGHPIYTYGKDQQEVIEKLARTNAHAQAALARKSTAPATPATPTATAPARMTADEVMQATQDLQNPAKSGTAVARLVQDATGIDLGRLALNNFAALAQEWQQETPDFYEHPGNMHLLVGRAKAYAGGTIANVTKEHLSRAFDDLQHEGMLFEAPASQSTLPNNQPTPSPVPDENQVQRTERPRGSRFATSTRSTGFRAAPQHSSQTRTPKYTAEEIRSMPNSKSRALIDANDADYNYACEFHFGDQATA